MNTPEFNPSNGLLLVCERDDAKRIFAARSDEALTEFFKEYLSDSKNLDQDRTLDLQSKWLAIHACFCGGSTDSSAGDLPLNQIILGGRPLGSGSQFQAILVRPDFVPHIVAALESFKQETAEQAFQIFQSGESQSTATFEEVWSLIGKIEILFETAAELRAAVVFHRQET